MFSIEAKFDFNELDNYIQQETDAWLNDLMETYREAGRLFVEKAREKIFAVKRYTNRTHDLISSTGFMIFNNGELIESYFPTVGPGDEGSKVGEEFANKTASKFKARQGVLLVVVAGEYYADFLQVKGYDVLEGTENFAEKELPRLLGI